MLVHATVVFAFAAISAIFVYVSCESIERPTVIGSAICAVMCAAVAGWIIGYRMIWSM